MKKKKVLFLIESFIVGGAEKVLIDIVNHLNSNKYDITVCSVFKHSVYKGYDKTFEKPFKDHINYRYLINNTYHWLYLIFNFLLARFPNIIYQLFIGDKFDTVIAFYEGLPTYWISNAKLKKGKKIAWLHTSTQLSQQGKSFIELEKQYKYYTEFEKIVAVSQGVADSFTTLFNLKDKVTVIYNPINSQTIIKQSQQSLSIEKTNYPTFVSVGRMTEAKGYDRWLRVLLKLKNKGYKFRSWIIGGGDRDKYEAFVKDNHLTDYIIFLGHQDNPYPYIQQANWIACPSLVEGLSTVVLESLILKKAIITTDCPGMKELLGENQYGIVCDNNEETITYMTEKVLCIPSLQKQYESALLNYPFEFELKKSIYQIENLLDA